jgi:adenine nucleotide transporter 17
VAESLVVAAVSGAINQLLTLPASVVATRMLTSQREGKQPTLLSVTRSIWVDEGIGGFWSGIVPALVLVVNPAIQYLIYEQLLRVMRGWKEAREKAMSNSKGSETADAGNRSKDVKLSAGEIFIASSLAKLGATIATYPLIVVKARMQSDGSGYHVLRVIGDILRADGLGGFFRGLRAKILQAMLNSALLMTLKEQLHSGVKDSLSKGLNFKDLKANLIG